MVTKQHVVLPAAAQRLRVASVEKAEAQKVQVVKAAEAEAEAKYLQGQVSSSHAQSTWRAHAAVISMH